jgi:hypothetical protein
VAENRPVACRPPGKKMVARCRGGGAAGLRAVRTTEESRRGRESGGEWVRGGWAAEQLGCSVPEIERRGGGAAFCSNGCSCYWSTYSSGGWCILGMQHAMHMLLESVLIDLSRDLHSMCVIILIISICLILINKSVEFYLANLVL